MLHCVINITSSARNSIRFYRIGSKSKYVYFIIASDPSLSKLKLITVIVHQFYFTYGSIAKTSCILYPYLFSVFHDKIIYP